MRKKQKKTMAKKQKNTSAKRQKAVAKNSPAKPATKFIKEVCFECGYSAVIRGTKCPMCVACPRCGRKLMHCTCIEGE